MTKYFVYLLHSRLFIQKERRGEGWGRRGAASRLHVSAQRELLNYCWMFLITSHKGWNTTLAPRRGSMMSPVLRGKH